jgi:hypothetical protein
VHPASRRLVCTRPTGRRRRVPRGRQRQRRTWQPPTRQRPEFPFPECTDRHAPNSADQRIRGCLIAPTGAAATHRTGTSHCQDESRCRKGPMTLTGPRAGLLSGHRPVEGRTVQRLQSAHDTSGESASVLLSHGNYRRWNSCCRMSDWCHINAITLGERGPSRRNARVPRRV